MASTPVHHPEQTCLDEMYLQRLIHRRRLHASYTPDDWREAQRELDMWEKLIGERMKIIEMRSHYDEPRHASSWAGADEPAAQPAASGGTVAGAAPRPQGAEDDA